jgi:hypothetical protein
LRWTAKAAPGFPGPGSVGFGSGGSFGFLLDGLVVGSGAGLGDVEILEFWRSISDSCGLVLLGDLAVDFDGGLEPDNVLDYGHFKVGYVVAVNKRQRVRTMMSGGANFLDEQGPQTILGRKMNGGFNCKVFFDRDNLTPAGDLFCLVLHLE